MDRLLEEWQLRTQKQMGSMLEEQQVIRDCIRRSHQEEVSRLETQIAELRSRLEFAERRSETSVTVEVPGDDLSLQEFGCALDDASSSPSWAQILCSEIVRLHFIADEGSLTLYAHTVVLKRSPYFRTRLATRWCNPQSCPVEAGAFDGEAPHSESFAGVLLVLRLPAGCPAAAALLIVQHLYTSDPSSFGLPGLKINDAVSAVAASQVASMLLCDEAAEEMAHLACSLVRSPAEAFDLTQRFTGLPSSVAEACVSASDVPATTMTWAGLAKMLEGSARSSAARPMADTVLAAHGQSTHAAKAVVTALETLPFVKGVEHAAELWVTGMDSSAFNWIWGLARRYVLVPGCSESLLTFFGTISGVKRPVVLGEEHRPPLQMAFGMYLEHLARIQSADLSPLFRLGLQSDNTRRPRLSLSESSIHLNALHFSSWSKELLPRLFVLAGPLREKLRDDLLRLQPAVLAEVVDGALLKVLGPDVMDVCKRITEDCNVVKSWATRERLEAVALVPRRYLCLQLAPALGVLPTDVGTVVVAVTSGTHFERAKERTALRIVALAMIMSLLAFLVIWSRIRHPEVEFL